MAAAEIKRTNHSSGHFLYEISNQFSVLKSLKDELKRDPTGRAQFKKDSLHTFSFKPKKKNSLQCWGFSV